MPKIQYTKEIILEAALAIVSREGFEQLSVRNIAQEVGSSTAPIYTAYKNRNDLIKATKSKAMEMVFASTNTKYTDDAFLNIGVGLLVFARDHANLYRELFITSPDIDFKEELFNTYLKQLAESETGDLFSDDELNTLLSKMWIFTYGLGTLICTGQLSDNSTDFYIRAQFEIGRNICTAMLMQNPESVKLYEQHIKGDDLYEEYRIARWNIW